MHIHASQALRVASLSWHPADTHGPFLNPRMNRGEGICDSRTGTVEETFKNYSPRGPMLSGALSWFLREKYRGTALCHLLRPSAGPRWAMEWWQGAWGTDTILPLPHGGGEDSTGALLSSPQQCCLLCVLYVPSRCIFMVTSYKAQTFEKKDLA